MDFDSAVKKRGQELFCSSLENIGVPLDYFRNPPFGNPVLQNTAWRAARDLYRRFCNREPVPGPSVPFPGGQCSDRYQVRATKTETYDTDQIRITTDSVGVWGPILSFQYETDGFGNPGGKFTATCFGRSSDPAPSPTSQNITISQTIFPPGSFVSLRVAIDSIERFGGLPDNCGNGPSSPPAPILPPDVEDPGFTYIDNDGNTINVPIVFGFGFAYFDIDGTVKVPVTFNVKPTFDIPVTIAPKFTINFNLNDGTSTITGPTGPSLPPSAQPSDRGNPSGYGPSQPAPEADPDVPEPPPTPDPPNSETVIRAVLVTVTELSPNAKVSSIAQDDNPDVYAPDLGLVQFLIRTGNISGGWTEDIRVKNKRQFIPCPWEGGAIDVKGTPRNGVDFVLTPIYGKVQVPADP